MCLGAWVVCMHGWHNEWAMRRQPQLTVLIICCALVPRRLVSGRSSTPRIAVILSGIFWTFPRFLYRSGSLVSLGFPPPQNNAGHGPALGSARMCMPRGVLVGLCAGCRRSKGVGKRAQDPTRDRSQACFSRLIMLAFISLQILPTALVRLCASVREGVRVRGRVRGRVYAHVCVRVCAQIDEIGAGCLRAAPGPTEICASIPRGLEVLLISSRATWAG